MNNNIFLFIGVFWKILSCFCFAIINICVRYLSGGSPLEIEFPISIYNIMFFQNIIVVIILTPLFIDKVLGTIYTRLHILRIFFASSGMFFFYLSLKFLPITKVIALGFINPILTIVGARLFLKEIIDLKKYIIILSILIGTFFIVKPDLFSYKHNISFIYFPIISSVAFALDKIISKKIMILENKSLLLSFYLFLITIPIYFIFILIYGLDVLEINNLILLIFLGFFTILAQYSFNKAFFYVEVIILIPYGLSKFIISGILEYFLFKETPKVTSVWLGIFIIIITTILVK